ncbi:pyrimidine-nucleoside phosphorylase [Microbacterium sp. APC 3898]|uniref:Pyrimidine-nucleoside phosphorylase n=1 Tax=Planococcus notacanthi TaxID=3035188 RepID=A0ABT7ZGI0_9BACL|nr:MULTISPECIES: pyrimidine-nucleoside phosphorylase [Terrabacteria group]MBF6633006.1 pyrimidine-nucleoside phosphorylase [Planococcus sp. (in: firmicutes)]MDN3426244.1 pyrimidine-nucleoside phosphorylase [Planococcus sp. APC 4016]MDN3497940.1 pyrimidine-nucleoside phosphorylase [Microbacterium sp. APC 3898]
MRMVDLIEKKRDGHELSTEEIKFVITGYTSGDIADYQMSAFLMAVYFQNMTERERADLTLAMAESGDQIDLSAIDGIKVDKHSTGGVGDTTTLVLGPLVAACGVPVAKMSGRGLGHTGGTIDKLEAIDGFHVELSTEDFIKQVNDHKLAVIGQSGNLTPADKKMYALRDVTGTVNSIPLIASSIMSKKIAAGADAIVLDVKTGEGAFMKTPEDAKELAHAMVGIGNATGRKTMAIISDMSQPLGFAIGNALEVKEAIETLQGKGPEDLTELCMVLGSQMVVVGGKAETLEEARTMLEQVIENGQALEVFKQFIKDQGGNPAVVDDVTLLPQAEFVTEVPSKEEGYISFMEADEIGTAAMVLGAGRATKESEIDLAVGIVLHKKVGDFVKAGESIATIYSNAKEVAECSKMIYNSIEYTSEPVDKIKLISALITD